MINLWKLNKNTGYWVICRQCLETDAKQWLDIFQTDEPKETFKLSKNKPN
jgi:hypothetical protein